MQAAADAGFAGVGRTSKRLKFRSAAARLGVRRKQRARVDVHARPGSP
jgi:hypothetical protein